MEKIPLSSMREIKKGKQKEESTSSQQEVHEKRSLRPDDYKNIIRHVINDKDTYSSAFGNSIDLYMYLKERIVDEIVDQSSEAKKQFHPPFDNRYQGNVRKSSFCETALEMVVQPDHPSSSKETIIQKWLDSPNNILSETTKKVLGALEPEEMKKKRIEQEKITDRYDKFLQKMEDAYKSDATNRPILDAYNAIKGELDTIKSRVFYVETKKINAEKAQKYLLRAQADIKEASSAFKDIYFKRSAIPEHTLPKQALPDGLKFIKENLQTPKLLSEVRKFEELLDSPNSGHVDNTEDKLKKLSESTVDSLKQLRNAAIHIIRKSATGPDDTAAKNIDEIKEIKMNVEELLLYCEKNVSKTIKENIDIGRKNENLPKHDINYDSKNDRKRRDKTTIPYPSSPSQAFANLYRCQGNPAMSERGQRLPETLQLIWKDLNSLSTTEKDDNNDTKRVVFDKDDVASNSSKKTKTTNKTYETATGSVVSFEDVPGLPEWGQHSGLGILFPKQEDGTVHKRKLLNINEEKEIKKAIELLKAINETTGGESDIKERYEKQEKSANKGQELDRATRKAYSELREFEKEYREKEKSETEKKMSEMPEREKEEYRELQKAHQLVQKEKEEFSRKVNGLDRATRKAESELREFEKKYLEKEKSETEKKKSEMSETEKEEYRELQKAHHLAKKEKEEFSRKVNELDRATKKAESELKEFEKKKSEKSETEKEEYRELQKAHQSAYEELEKLAYRDKFRELNHTIKEAEGKLREFKKEYLEKKMSEAEKKASKAEKERYRELQEAYNLANKKQENLARKANELNHAIKKAESKLREFEKEYRGKKMSEREEKEYRELQKTHRSAQISKEQYLQEYFSGTSASGKGATIYLSNAVRASLLGKERETPDEPEGSTEKLPQLSTERKSLKEEYHRIKELDDTGKRSHLSDVLKRSHDALKLQYEEFEQDTEAILTIEEEFRGTCDDVYFSRLKLLKSIMKNNKSTNEYGGFKENIVRNLVEKMGLVDNEGKIKKKEMVAINSRFYNNLNSIREIFWDKIEEIPEIRPNPERSTINNDDLSLMEKTLIHKLDVVFTLLPDKQVNRDDWDDNVAKVIKHRNLSRKMNDYKNKYTSYIKNVKAYNEFFDSFNRNYGEEEIRSLDVSKIKRFIDIDNNRF